MIVFLVLEDQANAWPELRLKDTPGYEWKQIGMSGDIPLVLIQKRKDVLKRNPAPVVVAQFR